MKTMYKFFNLVNGEITSSRQGMTWKPGVWNEVKGDIGLCRNGLHASERLVDAFNYVHGLIVAEVEVAGRHDEQDDKQAWQKMRIVKAWKWEKKDYVALSIFSAELVIYLYEARYPGDDRPRKAIEAARQVLKKDTLKTRQAASSSASAAYASASAAASSYASAYAAYAYAAYASAAASSYASAASAAASAASAYASAAASAYASAAASAAKRQETLDLINDWMLKRLETLEEVK